MRRPKAATPAPAAAGNRCQGVSVGSLDISTPNTSDIAAQQDNLAASIVAVRFALPVHIAQLVCRLAGLGPGAPR